MVEAKITELLNCLAAFMAMLVALRVLLYRRGNSRYRPLVGSFAWALINGGFIYSGWLILSGYSSPVVAGVNVIILFLLTVQLHQSRGNLAPLVNSLEQWLRRVHT